MKIKLQEITVRELTSGYINNEEEGVLGYNGKLNIRPPYQREFVYKDKQRNAVIETVLKNFPLNVMYWVKNNGSYEILDGQQRTVSICDYIAGDFTINRKFFHNLTETERQQIFNYKLMIYFCEGNDKEKLDWFKIINTAGEKLTNQELRNAIYTGTWLADAKRFFSRSNGPAFNLAKNYMAGSPLRQDYLETVLKWINNNEIDIYMAEHQHDPNASQLWQYFNAVINWVETTFPTYRREMKDVAWGELYNKYKDQLLDSNALETEISKLMQDDDITNKKGIYTYVLSRKERHLNVRAFSQTQKREAYERQGGICPACNLHFKINEMDADHIVPWHAGGRTSSDNCRMLCQHDNRALGGY